MISTMMRDHPERRQVLRALAQPEVVLGGADQPGGEAAERVRERGPLRHRRERHPGERHADREARDDRASTIQQWWTTSGSAQVATTASAMPATPAYTPLRAVAGAFIQCSAKTNSAVAMM